MNCPNCKKPINDTVSCTPVVITFKVKSKGGKFIRVGDLEGIQSFDLDSLNEKEKFKLTCSSCGTSFTLLDLIIPITCDLCSREVKEAENYCEYNKLLFCTSHAKEHLKFCSSCPSLLSCKLGQKLVDND